MSMQFTCIHLSQLSHWSACCPHFTAFWQSAHGYLRGLGPGFCSVSPACIINNMHRYDASCLLDTALQYWPRRSFLGREQWNNVAASCFSLAIGPHKTACSPCSWVVTCSIQGDTGTLLSWRIKTWFLTKKPRRHMRKVDLNNIIRVRKGWILPKLLTSPDTPPQH